MSVTDIESRKRGAPVPDDHDEQTGVVTDDAADDTPEVEAAPAEEPKPTPPMQIALPGDWDTIAGTFGGRDPDTSEIRLLGGKMPIEGSFAKGTVIDLLVRVKITGVLGQDTVDAFGQEESTIRRHMARMIAVRRAPK